MPSQNYGNHRQYVPLYHVGLFGLLLLLMGGSIVNLIESDAAGLYSASLLVAVSLALFGLFYFSRAFALRAQDRAIRAEENLRHFALTGSLLDPRLSLGQVIALRFAADDEFVALAARAADEAMDPDAIKQAVAGWRADHHRV